MTNALQLPADSKRQLALERNPYASYLSSLSPGSRPTMVSSLARVVRDFAGYFDPPAAFPWHQLRYIHLNALRDWLGCNYAPATANRILSAVRGILKEAWRHNLIEHADYAHAVDVKRIPGARAAPGEVGRQLTRGELIALVDDCGDGPRGDRDRAMLALLSCAGLRRSELVQLDRVDVDPDERKITVVGKGRKTRIIPLRDSAMGHVMRWEEQRELGVPLIVPMRGKLSQRIRRMSTSNVRSMLGSLARRAGVKDFAPHDLRRTYCSMLLDSGADLATVQKLMGHADPSTTAGYDLRDERAKREAADLLYFPEVR